MVGYKAGSLAAGSILLWLQTTAGWQGMWLGWAALYLLSFILVSRLRLAGLERGRQGGTEAGQQGGLTGVLGVAGTGRMVVFCLLYKLCERGEQLLPLFLLDRGAGLHQMSAWAVARGAARWARLCCTALLTALCCSVAGSLAGGWLLSVRSLPTSLVLRAVTAVRCLPILLQAGLVQVWSPAHSALLLPLGLASHALGAFLAGLITTATFTAMMSVSRAADPACQARYAGSGISLRFSTAPSYRTGDDN